MRGGVVYSLKVLGHQLYDPASAKTFPIIQLVQSLVIVKIAVPDAGTHYFDDSLWDCFKDVGELQKFGQTDPDDELVATRIAQAEAVFTNNVALGGDVLKSVNA
jgi:hypothetical protein